MAILIRGVRGLLKGLFIVALMVLLSGCGERFPDPTQEGEFERTVLLEEGTGTWCVNCPAAAANIQTLLEEHPGEFLVLALHSQTQDPYSTQETEDRLGDFGVVAFPTIIFDGVEIFVGVQTVQEMAQILSDRRALGSPLKLELAASLTQDSVHYDISVIVSEQISESIDGLLRIALVEDTLTHSTAGLLHHIVRRLPEADAPVTLNPGDTVDLSKSLFLETSWGRPLVAVVWIEDEDHKVYQAAAYELGGGSTELGDFSVSLEADTIQTLPQSQLGQSVNFDFSLENHTGNSLTVTVDVPVASQDLPNGWWLSLCDTLSCYPAPSDFEVPAEGSREGLHVTIGTSIEEGDSEGSVMMTVTSGQEVDSVTFILRVE